MTSHASRAAYIHVPFCRHRCGYCNFTLVAGRDDLIDAYLTALEKELSWLGAPQPVDTLFFGGGTPTHLSPDQLRRLLSLATRWFPRSPGHETSVEANPADLTDERLDVLAEFDVTRLSLGVQSFDRRKLELLERDHDRMIVEQVWQRARARFASLSLDLIFGVPGETLAGWQADLNSALALQPNHISTYGLTFEKGTSFWSRKTRGEMSPTDEDLERQMYETAINMLTAAAPNRFEHYEVSNFARPGFRCRHNEVYWTGGGYFAAGPGAARFLNGRRELNHRSTTTYIQRVLAGASPVAESEQLAPEEAARERLVFSLRRLDGISREQFFRDTGFEIESLAGPMLQQFIDNGFLAWRDSQLQLTRAGLLISDALWTKLLQPAR